MSTKGNVLFNLTTEMTPKIDSEEVAFSLRSRDYKDPQCIVYRKSTHPHNKEEGQKWEETEVNDTLNIYDNGEIRTPTLVIENHPTDSRIKICEDGVFQTLSSRMGTGGNNVPMVMEDKDIQQNDMEQEGGDVMEGVGAVVRRLTPL